MKKNWLNNILEEVNNKVKEWPEWKFSAETKAELNKEQKNNTMLNIIPEFVDTLVKELHEKLNDVGIDANVKNEPVGGKTKLYRITVISKEFEYLTYFEQQSLVWRITEKAISPEDQIKIICILTLTSDKDY